MVCDGQWTQKTQATAAEAAGHRRVVAAAAAVEMERMVEAWHRTIRGIRTTLAYELQNQWLEER